MKPEHQQRASLIVSIGMETEANASDFAAVATAAHAQSVSTPNGRRFTGKDTMIALMTAGHNVKNIITKMRSDPLASELMNMLPNGGVDWADADSQLILNDLKGQGGAITQEVIDAITAMSVDVSSPAEGAGVSDETTALDFQIAWIVHKAGESTQDAVDASEVIRAASVADEKATLDAAKEAHRVAVADAAAIHQPSVSKLNAVNAWLQVFEGTTAAEWQAEVDDLLASPDGNGSHGA